MPKPPGQVLLWRKVTLRQVRAHADKLFVFADNLQAVGREGYAGQLRGEPNTVGIVTKRKNSRDSAAYLTDQDLEPGVVRSAISCIRVSLAAGIDVVIADGCADQGEMVTRDPRLNAWLMEELRTLIRAR